MRNAASRRAHPVVKDVVAVGKVWASDGTHILGLDSDGCPTTAWFRVRSSRGTYYWNQDTNHVQWSMPACLRTPANVMIAEAATASTATTTTAATATTATTIAAAASSAASLPTSPLASARSSPQSSPGTSPLPAPKVASNTVDAAQSREHEVVSVSEPVSPETSSLVDRRAEGEAPPAPHCGWLLVGSGRSVMARKPRRDVLRFFRVEADGFRFMKTTSKGKLPMRARKGLEIVTGTGRSRAKGAPAAWTIDIKDGDLILLSLRTNDREDLARLRWCLTRAVAGKVVIGDQFMVMDMTSRSLKSGLRSMVIAYWCATGVLEWFEATAHRSFPLDNVVAEEPVNVSTTVADTGSSPPSAAGPQGFLSFAERAPSHADATMESYVWAFTLTTDDGALHLRALSKSDAIDWVNEAKVCGGQMSAGAIVTWKRRSSDIMSEPSVLEMDETEELESLKHQELRSTLSVLLGASRQRKESTAAYVNALRQAREEVWSQHERRKFRIISFDGGGLRGVIPSVFLERFCEKFPDFIDSADMFVGCSQGAINSVGLALGYDPQLCREVMLAAGGAIFKKKIHGTFPIRVAKFTNKYLRTLSQELAGRLRLRDLDKRILIPALKLDNELSGADRSWETRLYHNMKPVFETEPNGENQGDIPLSELIMRTTAAPCFFPSNSGFVDGGLFAQNPVLAAVTHVHALYGIPLSDIVVCSLGTGCVQRFLDGDCDWGLVQWTPKMAAMSIDGIKYHSNSVCAQLLGANYFRFSPPFKEEYMMDEPQLVPEFIDIAMQMDLTHPLAWIERFWYRDEWNTIEAKAKEAT